MTVPVQVSLLLTFIVPVVISNALLMFVCCSLATLPDKVVVPSMFKIPAPVTAPARVSVPLRLIVPAFDTVL